eukprot:scaffold125648_cov73-Cyclotella_meneghiniana.AAC.2
MRELNAEMKKFCRCCDNMIKANSIRQQLPLKYEIREVVARPVGLLTSGDYFVFDRDTPRGTDKYCLECAYCRDWEDEEDDITSYRIHGYNQSPITRSAPGSRGGLGGLSIAKRNPSLQIKNRNCVRQNHNARGVRTKLCPRMIKSYLCIYT